MRSPPDESLGHSRVAYFFTTMSDDSKRISIRNTRTCGLNPKTRRNEEIYESGDGRKFFASDMLISRSDTINGTYLITKQVKNSENICSERTHHTNKPGVIQFANNVGSMDFGAQKDTDSIYRYRCKKGESLLDAWRANSTYLSTSTGTTHETRQVIVLDIDDNYTMEQDGFAFGTNALSAVKSRVSAKISEIADAGLPLPSSASINAENGHYQLHWYMDKPVRKTSYKYDRRNDQCDELSAGTASGEGYIIATHLLNIMFGGDIGYTGWRCRNIYCTHLEQYANYKVCDDGSLERVGRGTEFIRHDTPKLYARIFTVATDGRGDRRVRGNWGGNDRWDTILGKWKGYWAEAVALYEAHSGEPKQSDKDAKPTESKSRNTERKPTELSDLARARSEIYGRDFRKISEIYSTNRVEAIYGAYINDHIGRNAYWIKSPKLVRLLEPDITQEKAYSIIRQAYGRLIDAGGGKLNGTQSSEPFTEKDIRRAFAQGWKYATDCDIHRGWTDEQRKRSSEVNRIKYELRCLAVIDYLIRNKIDISEGVSALMVKKLSGIFNKSEKTIRKMLKECSIETSRKRRYRVCQKATMGARQAKSYMRLYSSVKAHLDESNCGKDTARRTFESFVMEDDTDFCNRRNTFLCTVSNAIAQQDSPKPTETACGMYACGTYGYEAVATAGGHAPPDTR